MLVKLEDYVELRQGLAINAQTNHLLSSYQSDEFKYPLLKIVDMVNNKFNTFVSNKVNKNVIAEKDDIIYTRTGQIGLAFRGFNGIVHNNSFIVTIKSDLLHEDYLFMILNSEFVRKQAITMAKNSVQPDLTHSMFKSIKIPLYDIDTQKKIARIVLNIENQIKQNNKMVNKLQVLALNIFDYYSKDNDITNSVILKNIIIEKEKSSIQVNDILGNNGNIPFYTSGESILYTNSHLTEGFNIFLSTGGNAKVQSYYGKSSYSTDTWCISAKNELQYYLFGYLKKIESQMDKLYFHGTGLKHLQKPIFLKSIITIPNKELLRKYNNIVKPIYMEISKIKQNTVNLQIIKNILLPLLINQQLI